MRMREVELMAEDACKPGEGAEQQTGQEEEDESSSRNDQAPLLSAAVNAAAAPASTPASNPKLLEEDKFAAYVRSDSFGTLGRGALCWGQRAMLLLAFVTIVPVRVVLLFLVLLTYYIVCRVFTVCRSPSEEEGQENYGYLGGTRRFIIVHSGRILARIMLFVLGFYWIKVNQYPARCAQTSLQEYVPVEETPVQANPGAIVSNHVSYLDILYHMSASFPSFVAKRSVTKLPLVGLISKCLGCIYVQRESKTSNTKGVSGIVAERLRAAHTERAQIMLLFPEGTTTNGKHLLPFKTGAFLSQTPVLPVILKYPYSRFSPAWESISGVRHVLLLLCQPVNYLEVTRLPVYCPSEKEKGDAKLYANNVRVLMAKAGDLSLSDAGLQDKRMYLSALRGKS